jgi:hypothetical protein
MGVQVAEEVHQVAAVALDRVVRQQRVADPGDEGCGDEIGLAAEGLQGPSEEGVDLVGGGGIPLEKIAPFGDERHAGRGQPVLVGRNDWV